jgi:FkbM family methyltransferase
MSLSSFVKHSLGSEFFVPGLGLLGRRFPASRFVQRLCWHAGENARDKEKIRPVNTSEGTTLFLDLSDHMFRGIFFTGQYEMDITPLVKRLSGPGQVWWDIGANVGWFSLLLSRQVGPAGKTISFEPNGKSAALLRQATKGIENVQVMEVALGEANGSATLYVPKDPDSTDGGNGRPSLMPQQDIPESIEVTVQVSSVDHQIASGTPAPFGIKMDVEGFEAAVIAGAKGLFGHAPPAVIISEVTHRPALAVPQQLVGMIEALGYRAFHAETLKAYDATRPIPPESSKDFIFLHHTKADELLAKLRQP